MAVLSVNSLVAKWRQRSAGSFLCLPSPISPFCLQCQFHCPPLGGGKRLVFCFSIGFAVNKKGSWKVPPLHTGLPCGTTQTGWSLGNGLSCCSSRSVVDLIDRVLMSPKRTLQGWIIEGSLNVGSRLHAGLSLCGKSEETVRLNQLSDGSASFSVHDWKTPALYFSLDVTPPCPLVQFTCLHTGLYSAGNKPHTRWRRLVVHWMLFQVTVICFHLIFTWKCSLSEKRESKRCVYSRHLPSLLVSSRVVFSPEGLTVCSGGVAFPVLSS